MKPLAVIVEDEKTLAESLANQLRNDGYLVRIAQDGEEGIKTILEAPPDVVILDIMLPKLDGIRVCRMIRGNKKTADVLVLMLSAKSMEIDKIIALESGADDYMTKPFGYGELLSRLRALLRRGKSNHKASKDESEIVSGQLRISISARRAFKEEEELRLSNREFDLLTEFMRNKGAVLSRALLLEKVWGQAAFVIDKTIDVHVRWLREKIEVDPSDPKIITTIRGIGYRFEG